MPVYDSALDLIGNTPMVDVSPLSPNPRVRLVVKLEGQNPGGSVKDRAAKWMVDEAEKSCVRLIDLLAELSDLGKLDAGTAAVKTEAFDVFELLRSVASPQETA